MGTWRKELAFGGRLVMLGFGSVGQGALPLLLRHIEMKPEQIEVITPSDRGARNAREQGVGLTKIRIDRDNYRHELGARLREGDFLLNLSVDVSSKALIELCQERRAPYIDACTEPWPGTYTDR
jgi:homospermidine synthase